MWRQFTGERRVLGDLVERWNGGDVPESCGQRALDLADVAVLMASVPRPLAPRQSLIRPVALGVHASWLLASGSGHLSGSGTKILGSPAPGPTPPLRPDHPRDTLENLRREHSPHLRVARLVPADARNGPDLCEEAGAVTVDRQGELARKRTRPTVHTVALPLDLAVPAGDEWEPLGVDLDPEPIRLRECPELLDGPLLQRSLSPDRTRRHDVVHIPGREPKACQVGRRRYGVSQVLSREGAVVDETTPMLRTHFALECGVLQRLAAKRSGSILMSPSRPTERSRRRLWSQAGAGKRIAREWATGEGTHETQAGSPRSHR